MGRDVRHTRRRAIAGAAVTGGLAIMFGQRVSAQAAEGGTPAQPTTLASSISEIIVTASRRWRGESLRPL
jgi:hypothetical protein